MKPWQVLLTLSFLLLGGCLDTFETALPGAQAAPKALLGQWRSKDAWGEPLTLTITQAKGTTYQAVARGKDNSVHTYRFSVARHGNRWYVSGAAPASIGHGFVIGGFELNDDHQLLLYTLDREQLRQAVDQQELSGRSVADGDDRRDNGQGLHIDSPAERVLAYLDDPANSDVFVETARLQRARP
ncbi:hypothetical protein [Pseudomonas sp.]|uniref:hypothetical protein n=1 Tax=Pseudomonas sp. TaxID=306 RepID=UPI0028B21C2E|nr:hypothetical protein [Pseudomonas sp.]